MGSPWRLLGAEVWPSLCHSHYKCRYMASAWPGGWGSGVQFEALALALDWGPQPIPQLKGLRCWAWGNGALATTTDVWLGKQAWEPDSWGCSQLWLSVLSPTKPQLPHLSMEVTRAALMAKPWESERGTYCIP